jgi:hypothetical protein
VTSSQLVQSWCSSMYLEYICAENFSYTTCEDLLWAISPTWLGAALHCSLNFASLPAHSASRLSYNPRHPINFQQTHVHLKNGWLYHGGINEYVLLS